MEDENKNVSLCEVLDRVLNKGAVIVGDVTISVANVDLIYLGLQIILSSVETGRRLGLKESESVPYFSQS
jgi:hypothetical protein